MAMAVATVVGAGTTAFASSLTINPTFSSSLTSGQQSAIDAAITMIESDITSPNNINVSIYFGSMNSGLGQTNSATFDIPYYDYYLAFSALATSPAQQTALASLGPAPTGLGSGNPVNGNAIEITSAEARNLGLSGDAGYMSAPGGSGSYDGVVLLNTSMAVTPNSLSDNNYSLEAVANHEIDEVLGIGGSGSTLANGNTGPVGDLDLYRYSAPGVRSYSATSPLAYFSINGGNTVLSYFNQTAGADYGDWLSNPIPTGYEPQLQDAFGTPGANPTLGPNELAAFSAIGYQIEIAPEPSTFALVGLGLLGFGILRRRQSAKS
jgi:hypothetical protein